MKLPKGYTVWDVTNYLQTEEDIRIYIDVACEDDPGDGSLIRSALQDVTRAQNMSGLARQVGMSRAGLYKTLSPNGNPSFATIMRLTRALGMKVVIRPLPLDSSPSTDPESEEETSPANLETPSTQAKSPVG